MNRVLVTGGVGAIGFAVVRRLLGDPDFEVRVSDQREAPGWMREGCEMHRGDLREPDEARKSMSGCSHVIHLTGFMEGAGPHTLLEVEGAVHGAVIRAALDAGVTRYVYVSSEAVFERAQPVPLAEAHLGDCPAPRSADGFSKLAGEVHCRAAHEEHDLPYTICRPFGAYGAGVPGLVADLLRAAERPVRLPAPADAMWTLTHASDVADGIVCAMASPAGLNEDFNLAGAEPVTLGEVARLCCGDELELEDGDGHGLVASAEKAERLLGWTARIGVEEGIARLRRQALGAAP